jgi:LPS-assembly protein
VSTDPDALQLPGEIVIESRDFAIGGESEEAEFSNEVQIRTPDGTITAESATFDQNNVAVAGRVTFEGRDVKVFGEDAQFDREAETMQFSAAGFDLPQRPARGSAEQIMINPKESKMSLAKVLFTTCPVNDTDWELHARDVRFDTEAGLGTAHGVKLDFKGVPILYAPYFTFPIDDQRKSGFLTPDIGQRDKTGFDLSVPYYLNLAPNYDLTLEPRYMSKRGVQLRNEFRYLMPKSVGQIDYEYLPNDDEFNDSRSYVNFQHDSLFTDNWRLRTGIEEVSDDFYFEDLGSSLAVTSQTHLNRFVDLGYYAPYWSLLTRLQNYQTIDPVLTDEERPYERLPQMMFAGRWLGRLFGFDSTTELVNFDRNVGVTGWRLDSTQEASLRFARSGMYLTPAVALRHTGYWLDDGRLTPGADDTPTRNLPISSVDAGMKFERSSGRDKSWMQTLEPRMLYVHVPFEDQTDLPVFDTILPDFNLVQLFRKYQFVGPDRIADTSQLALGVTTRLIDEEGVERLTATLGQTRYRDEQHVSLPGTTPNESNASDYVAEMSIGREIWNLDVGYQWNSSTEKTARAETRFEIRPQDDRLFGFGYRYRPGFIEQGDISVVWPAADKWRVIGRYSYSFLEDEPLEQFVGWEYEACCWRFRMIGRRYVSRTTGEQDSAISIQLELKGLSQGAPTPEELLDRGILGYHSFAQPTG